MKIAALDIRACRSEGTALGLKDSAETALEFLVLTLRTECGLSASMFGFAGRSALGAGHLAASSLRPFIVGRDARAREAIWRDWRRTDRWWHHLPVYSYGPLDCCLWLLAAQAAGQPLWRYLGGGRDTVPTYASSLVLADPEAYAAELRAVRAAGFRGYKVHPPGRDPVEDIAIHRAVRDAAGPDFPLMSDPVQPYTYDEALRLGRALEDMSYLWLEEPLPDENFAALRELTRALDIPVVGCEVLARHPWSVAECVATRVVDAVRADVSWSGGVTGVLKTAALADAFHMNCELHSTIFHPLELMNLHCAAAVGNSGMFELLWPMQRFAIGLAGELPVEDGIAHLPEGPGLGMELDWNFIEETTIAIL
ncbi:enolase C-terminal domain-like protein [Tropicimonas sp.]|uniref:enolase C-terminal domain-like protein n=1 Tax=Tropicimonas sp. TaxID=2067044 RepID=UPI003A83B880